MSGLSRLVTAEQAQVVSAIFKLQSISFKVMRTSFRLSPPAILVIALIVLRPVEIHAQTSAEGQPAAPTSQGNLPRNEIGTFAVFPLANGSLKGVTTDRRFFLFGMSYSRLLGHSRVCDIRWVSEVMPLELLAEPFFVGTNIQALHALPPFTETRMTYGMGTNPAGADVIFVPGKKWQPFAGVHGGFSYFDRNVLGFEGARFNFMLDGRAGLRFKLRSGRSVSVAYMFQHMSNAYIAPDNPGVDSHMLHVAYTFPFRFRHTTQ
ncbi:MAG TPA: acyloxyacyl hydrolase [Candidatus Angelobacter sp.]